MALSLSRSDRALKVEPTSFAFFVHQPGMSPQRAFLNSRPAPIFSMMSISVASVERRFVVMRPILPFLFSLYQLVS